MRIKLVMKNYHKGLNSQFLHHNAKRKEIQYTTLRIIITSIVFDMKHLESKDALHRDRKLKNIFFQKKIVSIIGMIMVKSIIMVKK